MNKELTCIVCPNGCDLHIAYEKAQKPLRSFPLRGRYVSGGKPMLGRSSLPPNAVLLALSLLKVENCRS